MAFEKQQKQIGEYSYEVTQLGAKVGNRVLMKIAKSVAPMFLLAAGGGARTLDPGRAVEAIKDMSEDDFDWVISQLAQKTDVTLADGKAPSLGNPAIFDMHFAGRYVEELEWLEFAVEVNFGLFFQDLRKKAAALGKSAGAPTPAAST